MKRVYVLFLILVLLSAAGCDRGPMQPAAAPGLPERAMASDQPSSPSQTPSPTASAVSAPAADEPETISYQGVTFALHDPLEDVKGRLDDQGIIYEQRTYDHAPYMEVDIHEEDGRGIWLTFNESGFLIRMSISGIGTTSRGMTTQDTWHRGIELYGDDYIWEVYNYRGHIDVLEYQRDGYYIQFYDDSPFTRSTSAGIVNALAEGLFPSSIVICDASYFRSNDQYAQEGDWTRMDAYISIGIDEVVSKHAEIRLGMTRNELENYNVSPSESLMKDTGARSNDDGTVGYRYGLLNVDLFRVKYDDDGRIVYIATKHPDARTGRFLQEHNTEQVVKTLYGTNYTEHDLAEPDAYFGSDKTYTYPFHDSKLRVHLWGDYVQGVELFY